MSDINELATALNAFQAEVVTVGKDKANPFFKSKYAPLDEIMKAALPVLTKHGLAVTQLIDNLDGGSALTTVLMHKSGQSIRSTMPLLLTKDDPQGQGSAITYARRYSYAAILGIVIDEDDDGNQGTASRSNYQQAKAASDTERAKYARPQAGTQPITSKFASESQIKLMLARARDASGLQDRQEIVQWFYDQIGSSPNEVEKADVDAVLEQIRMAAGDQEGDA